MAKIDKNSLPEGFTVSMALVDALPVAFFAIAFLILGLMLQDILMMIGAGIAFVSGVIKVIWKLIVVLKRKNVWWMFLQMRIFMPIGLLLAIVGFIICCITKDMTLFWASFKNPASIILFIIGAIGITMMIVFSVKLDPKDPKSNWIEQICNSIAQGAIMLACLIAYL